MKSAQLSIPAKLKELRQRANLSRAELAQLLGTSLIAIDQWERSNTFPSEQQQQHITELLTKARHHGRLHFVCLREVP